jgi:hypothetical protein
MNRSLDQLNVAFDDLLARVNSIDGTNLPDPLQGQLEQIRRSINGLKATLGNVNMGYQQDISLLSTQLAEVKALVMNHLNPPPISA